MTPTAAGPTTANGRPEPAPDVLRVYVYDPLDPARRGEVREVVAGQPGELERALRAGGPVAYIPLDAELSIGGAAAFLNEPGEVVRGLLGSGRLPRCGTTFVQVRFADLLAYRDERNAVRREALDELRLIDQELGLGG